MPALATSEELPPLDAVQLRNAMEASIKAEGAKVDDYALIDQDGVKFNLSEYFKGNKPLVVSFIYTSCPQVCPTITAEFKRAIDSARAKYGDKFNVLTIGFDPEKDKPAKLKEYGHKFANDLTNFRLASSDPETIKKLTGQFGFFNVKRADGSFDHIDMVSVVRPDGRIYKQIYSVRTQSANIETRLEELFTGKTISAGGSASLVDKIKFFCYRYDPYTGKYVIDFPVIISFVVQALVISLIIFIVWGKRIKGIFRKSR